MRNHRVIGRAALGQRQRIGCRAIEDEEHSGVRLEQLTQACAGLVCPGIIAVTRHVSRSIGVHKCRQRLRAHAGVVV